MSIDLLNTIVSAGIGAAVALLTLYVEGRRKKKDRKRTEYNIYKSYSKPIIAAAESLAWRLREVLIGRNVRYAEYWNSYLSGDGYQTKFRSMETHAIEIQFENYSNNNPLFNFEVVYKTLKGYFHDLKKFCLSPDEYNHAGPLFIYEVNRGSGVWTLLGQLPYLLVYGTSLVNEKVIGQRLNNLQKKLEILEQHFGDEVKPELYQSFMNAKTPSEIEFALSRLFDE